MKGFPYVKSKMSFSGPISTHVPTWRNERAIMRRSWPVLLQPRCGSQLCPIRYSHKAWWELLPTEEVPQRSAEGERSFQKREGETMNIAKKIAGLVQTTPVFTHKNMLQVVQELNACIGCNECLLACPAISSPLTIDRLNHETLSGFISPDVARFARSCYQCGACVEPCPVG